MSVKKVIFIFVSYCLDFEKMSVKSQLKRYFQQHFPNDTIHTRMYILSSRFSKMSGFSYTLNAGYTRDITVINLSVERSICQLKVS